MHRFRATVNMDAAGRHEWHDRSTEYSAPTRRAAAAADAIAEFYLQ